MFEFDAVLGSVALLPILVLICALFHTDLLRSQLHGGLSYVALRTQREAQKLSAELELKAFGFEIF
jgi:hypothetical protein